MFSSGQTDAILYNSRLRSKRSTETYSLPEEADVDLKINGSFITLHLIRNDRISPAVPVFVKRNGKTERLNLPPRSVSEQQINILYINILLYCLFCLFVLVLNG